MNSATGASAAHTAGSGASILTEIAESTLPLILALHTLRMPAPRTRQTQRKDFATDVGAWFWHYRHGRAMFSTTSVCAAITAVVGTMCSTTGVETASLQELVRCPHHGNRCCDPTWLIANTRKINSATGDQCRCRNPNRSWCGVRQEWRRDATAAHNGRLLACTSKTETSKPSTNDKNCAMRSISIPLAAFTTNFNGADEASIVLTHVPSPTVDQRVSIDSGAPRTGATTLCLGKCVKQERNEQVCLAKKRLPVLVSGPRTTGVCDDS